MALVNVGTTANDGTGDTLRAAFQKVNANFAATRNITAAPYNAVGDNSTNNTTAIQACIDAGPGEVIVPYGIFKTGSLTCPIDVRLRGTSQFGSILKARASGTLLTHQGLVNIGGTNAYADLGAPLVENLILDGAGVGTDGYFIKEVQQYLVHSVLVKGFTGKGFRGEGTVVGHYLNCRAHGNAYGAHFKEVTSSSVYGGAYLPPNLITFTNCCILANTTYGIYYQGGNGLFLINTDVEVNGTRSNSSTGGIYAKFDSNNAINGLTLKNCWIEGNLGNAHIEIGDAPYLTLHSIEDTNFLDFGTTDLNHAVIVGGGGAATNELFVRSSGPIPSRAYKTDIYATGANSIVHWGAAAYFTAAGTIGRKLLTAEWNPIAAEFQAFDGSSWVSLGTGGAAPVDVISDTFTDTNGTGLASHTPDLGGTWTVESGTIQIQSNKAKAVATGSTGTIDAGSGKTDGTISFDAVLTGVGTGVSANVIFRQVTTSSLWYFILENTATPTVALVKYVSGTPTVVGSATAVAYTTNATAALKVVTSGNSIQCYYNGTLMFSATDAANNTGTRCGFYNQSLNGTVDNFKFTQP